MESSIACRDRWLSKAQVIQRCKSGHASSLAAWIESKSPSLGGRKIRRGVTIGIKWRIKRLRWNCSGRVQTKKRCLRAGSCPKCTVCQTVEWFFAATRVRLPCPPRVTRHFTKVLDKPDIAHIIKVSGKRCSSISKPPERCSGALAFCERFRRFEGGVFYFVMLSEIRLVPQSPP